MTRVAFDNTYRTATLAMGQANARLQSAQAQLGSTRRVNTVSDDPIAAPRILQLASAMAQLDDYDANLDFAEGRLAQITDHLTRISDLLTDIKEKAVQGSNGTYVAADRTALRTAVQSSIDMIGGFIDQLDSTKLGIDRTAQVSDGTSMPVSLSTADLNKLKLLKQDLVTLTDATSLSTATGWNALLAKVDGELKLDTDQGALVMATRYGAHYQQVETVRDTRSDLRLEFQRITADLRDADVGALSIQIARDQTVLEALAKTFASLKSASLFNFL